MFPPICASFRLFGFFTILLILGWQNGFFVILPESSFEANRLLMGENMVTCGQIFLTFFLLFPPFFASCYFLCVVLNRPQGEMRFAFLCIFGHVFKNSKNVDFFGRFIFSALFFAFLRSFFVISIFLHPFCPSSLFFLKSFEIDIFLTNPYNSCIFGAILRVLGNVLILFICIFSPRFFAYFCASFALFCVYLLKPEERTPGCQTFGLGKG